MSGILTNDTISALCTAPGGALSILRISGSDSLDILKRVWFGDFQKLLKNPRTLVFGHACKADGETCLAVYMRAPASYTGEDVCEIQFHGGTVSAKNILGAVLANGARAAEPGEFTRRAFVNGKLDLTQAEAVCDLVTAKTDRAFRLAEQRLSGSLGRKLRAAAEGLTHLLADFESRLDFSEEDLDWLSASDVDQKLASIAFELEKLLSTRKYAALCRDGAHLAIAGAPNAGKSSLMNALLGFDRAIVTDIPGTTRDTLEESISLRGFPLTLTDTAGLRIGTSDTIENIGMERSRSAIAGSRLVLWLADVSVCLDWKAEIEKMLSEVPSGTPTILVRTKCDLMTTLPPPPEMLPVHIQCADISNVSGIGLEHLADMIADTVSAGAEEPDDGNVIEVRHESLVTEALQNVRAARNEAEREAWELAASCLRNALFSLGKISGETASPDVLDEIFARFCIGK